MTLLAAQPWKNNGELIADLHHTLGYFGERTSTLDATYGRGVWWKIYRPAGLVTNDLRQDYDTDYHYDFRRFPKAWRGTFDTVAFDPPYKLNGKPSEEDERYGVHLPATWQERNKLCLQGITGCARLLTKNGILLVKCMDQVSRNAKLWQTIDFANHAVTQGLMLQDWATYLRKPRAQDKKRPQMHLHSNYSSLLIFRKT